MRPALTYEKANTLYFSPYYFLAKIVSTYSYPKHWYQNRSFTLSDCKALLTGQPLSKHLVTKIAQATNSSPVMWSNIDKDYQAGKTL